MIINLNDHSHFFAQKVEEKKPEPQPEIKNYGVGKLIQASYLDEHGSQVLYLDFNGARFFVSIPDGMAGSFARVGDKFNVTGFIQNPTLIRATEVQQQF